jgi:hypothetical protein
MTKYYINIMTNTRLTLTTSRMKKLENINYTTRTLLQTGVNADAPKGKQFLLH